MVQAAEHRAVNRECCRSEGHGHCCRSLMGLPTAFSCPSWSLCLLAGLTLLLSRRCASAPGPWRRLCLHTAQCLRPLHPHRPMGGAWREGQHQLCQDRVLCHRDIPHKALLRWESPQVGSSQDSGCVCVAFFFLSESPHPFEETRHGGHTGNPSI